VKRLFVELYLDEDVSVLVAELLRSHGFDALTSREADQLGKSDDEQLAYAVSQSRAVLSHNRTESVLSLPVIVPNDRSGVFCIPEESALLPTHQVAPRAWLAYARCRVLFLFSLPIAVFPGK